MPGQRARRGVGAIAGAEGEARPKLIAVAGEIDARVKTVFGPKLGLAGVGEDQTGGLAHIFEGIELQHRGDVLGGIFRHQGDRVRDIGEPEFGGELVVVDDVQNGTVGRGQARPRGVVGRDVGDFAVQPVDRTGAQVQVALGQPGLLLAGSAHVDTRRAAGQIGPPLADDGVKDDLALTVAHHHLAAARAGGRQIAQVDPLETLGVASLRFQHLELVQSDQQAAQDIAVDGVIIPFNHPPRLSVAAHGDGFKGVIGGARHRHLGDIAEPFGEVGEHACRRR